MWHAINLAAVLHASRRGGAKPVRAEGLDAEAIARGVIAELLHGPSARAWSLRRGTPSVFTSAPSLAILKRSVAAVRAAAATLGRLREDVLGFGQALIIIDETRAKAQANQREVPPAPCA